MSQTVSTQSTADADTTSANISASEKKTDQKSEDLIQKIITEYSAMNPTAKLEWFETFDCFGEKAIPILKTIYQMVDPLKKLNKDVSDKEAFKDLLQIRDQMILCLEYEDEPSIGTLAIQAMVSTSVWSTGNCISYSHSLEKLANFCINMKLTGLVDLMAGSGFVARVLSDNDLVMIAYDLKPWKKTFFKVDQGDAFKMIEKVDFKKSGILLSWIPYELDIHNILKVIPEGGIIVTINSWDCCGNEKNLEELNNNFDKLYEDTTYIIEKFAKYFTSSVKQNSQKYYHYQEMINVYQRTSNEWKDVEEEEQEVADEYRDEDGDGDGDGDEDKNTKAEEILTNS